ncbi:MAG: amidohydrolase [Halioglobus sp.]
MGGKKSTINSLIMIVGLIFSGVSSAAENSGLMATQIYAGGTIVTMDSEQPWVEAVAVSGQRILAVGSLADMGKLRGSDTQMVDLDGNTLLPGFIDAHGHFGMVGLAVMSANLAAPPEGVSSDIATIISQMKAHIDSPQAKESGVVFGMNYDDSQLAEKRHPTAAELDLVSTTLPVVILHQSGHVGVVNSRALELFGYNESTPNPAGGVVRRIAGSSKPNGVLEEMALFIPFLPLMTPSSTSSAMAMLEVAQRAYFASGFTTAQEGRSDLAGIGTLQSFASQGKLEIDVIAYPDPGFYGDDDKLKKLVNTEQRKYQNHFRVGGIKLSLDGSPQAKTAWLTKAYHVVPEGLDEDYAGYPAMKAENLDKYVDMAFANDWQILVHSNGDAAIDQFVTAVTKARAKYGDKDVRPVVIHAQTSREDQLDAMKALDVIPSFMTVHTFYWGDWHRDSVLGPERAMRISPTRSALDRNMLYTAHNDAPVTLPNAMMILSSQVNRTTRSGKVLGEAQRVPVEEALKSITVNAAYQSFEEDSKGSITPGKVADFVILDANPLAVESRALNDIHVVATIKGGKTVYSAP